MRMRAPAASSAWRRGATRLTRRATARRAMRPAIAKSNRQAHYRTEGVRGASIAVMMRRASMAARLMAVDRRRRRKAVSATAVTAIAVLKIAAAAVGVDMVAVRAAATAA